MIKFAVSFIVEDPTYNNIVEETSNPSWAPDYTKPRKELNRRFREHLKNKDFIIQYKGKDAKIISRIKDDCTGNIFENRWDDVEVWCRLDSIKKADFNEDDVVVVKSPSGWEPTNIVFDF